MRQKIFTLAISMLFFIFAADAQKFKVPDNGKKTWQPAKSIVKQNNVLASKAVVFSEDFASDTLPTGWQIVDNAGAGEIWRFDNPGAQTLNSTSSANGFAAFDSDFYGSGGGAEDCDLITPPIDCSTNTLVMLSFEHYFNSGWGGAAEVLVSGDNGTTWTSLEGWDASDTDNAELAMYDISSIAAGQTEVLVKFHWTGDYSWYWLVDDVSVYEPELDAGVSAFVAPQNPVIAGVKDVTVEISNYGVNNLTEATLAWEVNGTAQTPFSWTGDLAYGASEEVTLGTFDFPVGAHTLKVWTEAPNAGVDENNANDTLMVDPVNVIYAGQLLENFSAGMAVPTGWATSAGPNDFTWELGDDNTWFGPMDGYFTYVQGDINTTMDTLVTPQLTLDGSVTELSYDVIGGNNTGGYGSSKIVVKYSADGTTWTDVGDTLDLAAGEALQRVVVDLSAIPNGDYYFAFEVTSTFDLAGYTAWVGIDNVMGPMMTNVQANDLGIVSVSYPNDFVMDGDVITLMAEVQNFGTTEQTGTEVTLNVDGAPAATANIGTLAYSQTEMVEFTWTATAGHHVFEVAVPADDATGNDIKSIEGVVVGDGWLYEGFEAAFPPDGWVADTGSIWFQWADPFVGAYEGTTVAGTSVPDASTRDSVILATPKVAITGTNEMFHFYAALGNAGIGAHQLDLVYSADGVTWTDIAVDIPVTGGMELYSYDLSAIPAGAYHIGFRAQVTGDGSYSTLYAIDHVVGPQLAPVVTFNVDMNKPILMGEFDPANDTVILAGDMNTWAEPGTDPSMFMEDPDQDGIYTLSMELADGTYEYKYFNGAGWSGGEWEGADNRSFTVAGAPVTLNDVWANEYLVTFNVMQDGNPAEGATISIDGQDLTTDVDGMAYIGLMDGDYPYTVSLTGFDDITGTVTVAGGNETVNLEFITPIPFPFMDDFEAYAEGDYVADNSIAWTTWSEAPGTAEDAVVSTVHASSGVNSMLISGSNDMVLPFGDSTSGKYHVAFDIYVGTDSSAYWNIQHITLTEWAFEAYMNSDGTGELNADGQTIAFDFDLDAWHTVEHYIDLDNDEITLKLDGAIIHTWQFSTVAGGGAGTNQLGALNLYNGGATGTAAYYVDDVAFQSIYPVTFNVDMGDAIVDGDFDPATDTVIAAGSMNGWMEPGMDTTMFMHDMDEDSIYTLTMQLTDGDYEYKYFNGAGWNGGEWEGGDNRMFTVAGAAVVLDDVWAEGVGIDNTAEALEFNIYPNPTKGVLHIEIDGTNQVTIINAIGQVVNTVKINGHSTLDLSNNASGVYFIRVASENKVATKRIIVQ